MCEYFIFGLCVKRAGNVVCEFTRCEEINRTAK